MEMGQAIRGTKIETGFTPEQRQWCEEELERLVPPEELQRSLGKLSVQIALEPGFTEANHVACALPDTAQRSWMAKIRKVRQTKFGDTKGFNPADYELEAMMQDIEDVIWE